MRVHAFNYSTTIIHAQTNNNKNKQSDFLTPALDNDVSISLSTV